MSTEIDPQLARKLRQGFKYFNKFMVMMWRLGMGRWFGLWPQGWGQIMVITHTGRRTQAKHKTPVNFAILDGDIYCIAGFGRVSDWYRNILIHPEVEVWLPNSWWMGTTEDASEAENRPAIMRAVVIASGFAGPMFGVDPKVLDDDALTDITKDYKIIRIQRTKAMTGPGGPGDLSWVWQIATFILLPFVIFRKKRKNKINR